MSVDFSTETSADGAGAGDSHWSLPFAFTLGTLLLGVLSAKIGLSTPRASSSWHYPKPWPPLSIFWMVWIVIYPCWGYATYLVWRRRHQADVRGALALFCGGILSNFFFLPLAALTGDNPGVMTLGDLNGIFSSIILAWLFTRYDRKTIWFLLPLLVWMPITFALKVYYWAANM